MSKITKPSRKAPYRVILSKDENGCILEVKRKEYFIYEIKENGNDTVIASLANPYTLGKDERDEVYYLDYLPAEVLRKIDLLTTSFNYSEIAQGLNSLIADLSNNYSFVDFSMDHSYIIEDYKDSILQLANFTEDSDYFARHEKLDKFFQENFYDRDVELSEDEKNKIIATIYQELLFLESISSN